MTGTAITFETDTLASAMREVRGAVQRRNTIPILATVLIDAEAGQVRLTATDTELMVTRVVPASVEQASAFAIDAHRLADVVGSFTAGSQTTIRYDGTAAIVSSGRARLRFATLPRDHFPRIEQRHVSVSFEIDAKALTRGMNLVRHAISTDETRYYLNGIFLHIVDGKLVYAACDGHRLARYVDTLPDGAAAMPDTILGTRAVDLIRGAADARDAAIRVTVGDATVTMATDDYTIVAKVVDGTYPDYSRTIPTDCPRYVEVDRDALVEAAARVMMATSDKVRTVKLEVERDVIRASATSLEHGVASDELPCAYDASPFEIGFNGRYLRDALSALDVDQVALSFGRSGADPATVTSPKASGVTLVLMPMRV